MEEKRMRTIAPRELSPYACFKFWVVVISTMLLVLWVCAIQMVTLDDENILPKSAFYSSYSFPPPRIYKSNGYLMITPNGGLNQKRLGICDMIVLARYMNVTLIIPKFAHGVYWNDTSEFSEIFEVDHFIASLKDEVKILKELPPKLKRKVEKEKLYYMFPMAFASLDYYDQRVLPRIQKREILLLAQTDSRLANNGLPEELQKLRCRVNYKALKFTQPIEETGRKIVSILREKGPFMVVHLRYEKDVLAFTGCTEGLSPQEAAEVKQMRYSHDGWWHKPIDSKKKRERGSCPLTPEETTLVLKALGIDSNTTIYIASGEIYQKEKRMADLAAAYPNLARKETILKSEELEPFLNHAYQMAALDFIVAIESDIFLPTFGGNMATSVEGHRRYLGFKTTITLDRKLLVGMIDEYRNGTLSWDEFSLLVKKSHEDRTGKPERRLEIPEHPRQEDYFYANPQECLPANFVQSSINTILNTTFN